ncbi:MAG: ZIP family metal transporter [Bacilli bacterium]|nr:ZIP family metal transporter [Bacilli bacterium]
MNYFLNLTPIWQALIAGCFTFLVTSLGAAVVFVFKSVNKNIMDSMLAISAGIMLSASFFSLLNPAVEIAEELNLKVWLVVFIGIIFGGILLYAGDKLLEFLSKNKDSGSLSLRRCAMLFTSITLHNIPEGLVVGVAFGAIAYGIDNATVFAAISLTIGIAIQNFPEGSAISLPLRREGLSRFKSFMFAMLSGIVEPIAAVIGALLVMKIQIILPFILSFAAGAMIFVISMELIPESQSNKKKDLMAFLTLLGFSIMMVLEIVLG